MVITGGWCHTCHGSTAQQQSAFTLEYFVPYCRSVRHVPTLKMRVVLFLVSKKALSAASMYTAVYSYMCRVFFLLGWDLALYCTYVPRVCRVIPCPMLLVRTSYHTVFSGVNHVSREHSTAAVGFHFGVPRTILS